jgi:hypothetical protein
VLTIDIVRAGHQLGIGNPFLPLLYFVKGEIQDIKAMLETVQSRGNLIGEIKKISIRRVTTTKELEEKIQGSLTLSLSTFKTLFKNNEEK